MTRFFWRIFVSVWAIAMISFVIAVYFSRWLPRTHPDTPVGEQLAQLVASDMRTALAKDSLDAPEIATRYAIDVAPLLEVFILDAEGYDVLGRPVPNLVFQAIVGEEVSWWLPTVWPRVSVVSEGLGGYTVASYEGMYIFGRALRDPMARVIFVTVALLISAIVSALLAHFVTKPVSRLREAGRLVASGNLSVRVAPALGKRQDALAELAHDFDFMTERVALSLSTQRQMMRNVSHELRSPLARLKALVSIAGQQADHTQPEFLLRLENELDRLDELIGEILAFSRLQMQEDIKRTTTDIADLVRNIADDASIEAESNNTELIVYSPDRILLAVEHGLIHSAIENIIRNAISHTEANTRVTISVTDDVDEVSIEVSDNGKGVPEEALETIFLPFYRVEEGSTTRTGGGGIGLAIAAHAAKLHKGTVVARNLAAGGFCVKLTLPRN
ncbi:MAG: ATP-binding protein [Pseudomonadota bacterium]